MVFVPRFVPLAESLGLARREFNACLPSTRQIRCQIKEYFINSVTVSQTTVISVQQEGKYSMNIRLYRFLMRNSTQAAVTNMTHVGKQNYLTLT